MKKRLFILSTLLAVTTLVSCNNKAQHEHTFDEDNWEKNALVHWHKATCEHSEFTKDMAEHDFGDDNVCDVCGYVQIIENKHLVYFVSNGGTDVSPVQVLDGEKVACPEDPTKTDFTFLGWYESPEYTGNPYDFNKEVTKDTALYALWGAKVSFVNYDGETYKEVKVRLNSEIEKPQDPTWNNAHFLNWFEDSDFVGETFNFASGVTKNTKLYARYGYTVELINVDGSTLSNFVQPADQVLTNPGEQTQDYYDFDNWYSDADRTVAFEFGKKLTQDTKIYLKLTPKTYKITYVNADALIHANPTSYVYGVGLSSFLEPTGNEDEDINKFYGWYFDEQFTEPATTISNELHEDVTVYAKIGTYHTITYNGWPKSIENTNPTKATQYDEITFDGSAIETIDGLSNVKFKIDSEEVSSLLNPNQDTIVDVEFTSTKTTVIFDPNGGEILSKTPFIYIDGENLKGGKKKIQLTKNDGTFNLYDQEIMNQMESIDERNGLFKGFFKNSSCDDPLTKNEVNEIKSGSTIYAKFDEQYERNRDRNLPFSETGDWGETDPKESLKEINYNLYVPQGYKTINISFEVQSEGDHSAVLNDQTGSMKRLKTWGGHQIFTIKESVNIENMSKLQFQYIYNGTKQTFISYSLSFTLSNPDNCLVKCTPSTESVSGEFSYYQNVEIPYESIRRDYHSFDGWLDENGNKVDLSTEWMNNAENVTLKANWVYDGGQQFILDSTNLYNTYCSYFEDESLEFSDSEIHDAKDLLFSSSLEPFFTYLENSQGFEADYAKYSDYIETLNENMWDCFGTKLIEKLAIKEDQYVDEYGEGNQVLVEELEEVLTSSSAEITNFKDNPAKQVYSYKTALALFEAYIALYVIR